MLYYVRNLSSDLNNKVSAPHKNTNALHFLPKNEIFKCLIFYPPRSTMVHLESCENGPSSTVLILLTTRSTSLAPLGMSVGTSVSPQSTRVKRFPPVYSFTHSERARESTVRRTTTTGNRWTITSNYDDWTFTSMDTKIDSPTFWILKV